MTEQVRALLRQQPSLTIDAVAGALRCDRHRLQRHLRSETGGSFRQVRAEVMVALAIDRIKAGAALKTVAFDLGYSTERAFARVFERRAGVPPAAYRRR